MPELGRPYGTISSKPFVAQMGRPTAAPHHSAPGRGLASFLLDNWAASARHRAPCNPSFPPESSVSTMNRMGLIKRKNLIRSRVCSEPSGYFLPHFEAKSSVPPALSTHPSLTSASLPLAHSVPATLAPCRSSNTSALSRPPGFCSCSSPR